MFLLKATRDAKENDSTPRFILDSAFRLSNTPSVIWSPYRCWRKLHCGTLVQTPRR